MAFFGLLKFAFEELFRKEVEGLEPGSEAPRFEAADQHGRMRRLEEFRGRWVVLWFFPKADTPG